LGDEIKKNEKRHSKWHIKWHIWESGKGHTGLLWSNMKASDIWKT
jgi:hypothetical protein